MGSIGDTKGEFKPSDINPSTDFADGETQPFEFDSQFPVSPFCGYRDDNEDDDELNYPQDTVPLDDNNVAVEDGLEIQILNLGEETQVLDFGGETQVLDDLDCCENIETQLLDAFDVSVVLDSEGEGTDGTEVFDDGDEVSDDEVVIGDCGRSIGHEEKESLEQCRASTDECRSSGIHVPTATPDVKAVSEGKPGMFSMACSCLFSVGSVQRFTSVRAASLRASGLAARNAALREMNNESCSNQTDSRFSNQCTVDSKGLNLKVVENISQRQDQNSINFRIGCPTARKLFAEDCFTENKELSRNSEVADAREDLLEAPDCDGPLAGLSYIDSQEPGELSQANALDFVERFVNDKLMELDNEVDFGKSTGGNSKLISCAKGLQSLAKRTIERSTAGEAGNFEWDDFREDEGGGDIYRRMKEEFYGNRSQARKSSTNLRKPKGKKLNESCNVDQPKSGDKRMVHSESKLLLCKLKDNDMTLQEGQMNFRKNLSNEFDEQFNSDSSRGQLEPTGAKTGAAEELNDVGFDTQIAAEAIEALFNGEAATEPKANQGVQSISKGSSKASFRGKAGKRISSTSRKGVSCSDATRFTRQSKRSKLNEDSSVLLEKHSKNVRKESSVTTPVSDSKKGRKRIKEVDFLQESRIGSTDVKLSGMSNANGQLSILHSDQSGEHGNGNGNVKLSIDVHLELISKSIGNHVPSYPRERRSSRKMPVGLGESDKMEAQSRKPAQPDDNGKPTAMQKRSRGNNRSTCIPSSTRRTARSSVNTCPLPYFSDQNSEGKLSRQSLDKQGSDADELNCNFSDKNGRMISKRKIGPKAAKAITHAGGNPDAISLSNAENLTVNVDSDKSPKEKSRSPGSLCTTPTNHLTPINAASPVCMGEEYYKMSCKKNLLKASLIKELRSLCPNEAEPISPLKDMRKRRNLADVRVLFSNHLDEDILKQQKKILARLGIHEASTILDATHFITDKFVRTRNMLEAIASGKSVVSHLWLESIGQVNIHIDEEAYILRDIKKEKELGFCMPVSLARARKRPLLQVRFSRFTYCIGLLFHLDFHTIVEAMQGRRVLITPKTKPGKETISRLVTAVHGQAIERTGKSSMKDDKIPDDLLVLSCEEDYEICVPFLEKGAAVYSSELLLNGIVTQKLDYQRHRLFEDHVRRTRSTVWMKKDNKFHPVTKA
ncbi:hypothetical protein Gorai_016131 [Gossypium raimondii]|uniref:BRCT domain-containing protein n=1 Tax=Gossypium raimondii TaxID=29730 RepID=A0A7J8P7W1_GOSRA|nr:hypothetical protein [Gossypium raimondii]